MLSTHSTRHNAFLGNLSSCTEKKTEGSTGRHQNLGKKCNAFLQKRIHLTPRCSSKEPGFIIKLHTLSSLKV